MLAASRADFFQAITGYPEADFLSALAVLSSEKPPRIFWAGYDTARIVGVSAWPAWAVAASPRGGGEKRWCRPRQWTDLYGELQRTEWDKAVNAVLGHIITQPGQTEVCRVTHQLSDVAHADFACSLLFV